MTLMTCGNCFGVMKTNLKYDGILDRGLSIWKTRGVVGPGCYVVFGPSGECLYVGSSIEVDRRICGHWRNAFDGKGVKWRLGGETSGKFVREFAPDGSTIKVWTGESLESMREMEKMLIKNLKPRCNVRKKGAVKLPKEAVVVIVSRVPNERERAMIVGESKDKTC